MRERAFTNAKLAGLLGATTVLAGTFLSCLEGGDFAFGDCPNPDYGHLNRYGALDPCCIDKSTPCSSSECDGECMPTNANLNWGKTPKLFWYGNIDQAPSGCPDSMEGYWEAYAEPISVGECPGCDCSDPACVPPASVIASDTLGCTGPQFTAFPVAPDGSCSMSTPIQPNDLKSLAVLSPTVSACTPGTVPVVVPKKTSYPGRWQKKGIVCTGTGNGICAARGDVCVPSTVPQSGFMQCLENTTKGDELTPCPDEGKESGYKRQFVIYDKIDDKVACTPCQCGAPVGSVCTAAVSAYQDDSCATPIFKDYVVPLGSPQCVTIAPNLPLQGVTSEWITNQPGTCMPDGGKLTGQVDADHTTAHALCCWE